jgi:hypothetical protein
MLRTSLRLVPALLLSAGWVYAQVISSNFNTNSDGWQAYANADPTTTVAYSAAGGTGGTGAIILQEPANGANDYFVAAAKFTGNLSAYYSGTLSFDFKLNPAWDSSSEAAMVILTGVYNSSALSIGYLPSSGQYPNASGFTTFTFNLDTTTAWALTNGSDFVTGTLATPAQIQSIMGTVTSLRILGDWTNSQDRDLLDNVTLTAIPEPSIAATMVSGAALGFAILLRRRVSQLRGRA